MGRSISTIFGAGSIIQGNVQINIYSSEKTCSVDVKWFLNTNIKAPNCKEENPMKL